MDRQVFQTDSRSRWVRVKISIALILTLVCLFISVMVVSFLIDRIPNMPFKEDYSSVIMARKPYMKSNRLSKEYSGFRKYFNREHKLHSNYAKWDQARNLKIRRYNGNTGRYLTEWDSRPSGIRAAFYVSWDPMSFASLKTALGSLNLVIPEWYFINPATASVETHIDAKGYQLLKHSGIPVMPMLSNAWHGSFNAKGIGRILHDRVLRAQLVSSMLSACMKHGFVGINIDIEDLDETNNDAFTAFVKELSLAFHDHGLLVTQDIAPGNEDYDVKELAKYNDYLLLMAYDEHNALSDAGPVSSQQWIDRTVGLIAEQVPPEKVILGLAAYGYDWNEKADNNQSIGFNDAMSVADDTHSQIDFDEDTYSLGYAYKDNSGQLHQVFFNDAATNFNTMRFGSEYRLAGFGVWRLGSEDRRLWSFYNKDLTRTGAARLRVGDLEVLHGSRYANYLGEGEVMDIINTPHDGNAHIDMDNENLLIARETYTKIPTSYDLRKYGSCGKKDLLLTFDDGPDRQWTPAILKTLRHYGVHAAFFMVGLQMERNLPVVRDVFEEGHLIGNHTFTHRNVATNTPQRTYMELRLTRMLIETCTGHSTILFRAPYNADSDPSGSEELIPLAEARKQNFINVGEAVDPNDWQPGVTADEIFRRVVKSVEHGEGHIILLHDAGGDTRKATVDALPRIISYFQQHGYRFITLEQYLGESKTDLMPQIPKGREYYVMQANLKVAQLIYNTGNIVNALLIVFLILGMGRLIFMWYLMVREDRMERSLDLCAKAAGPDPTPRVAIIIPAYNEEVDAVASTENLLRQDYPNFHLVFVDDGSTDQTFQRMQEAFRDNPHISILTKPNGGKASALNFGIRQTDAEYVVCVDADTKLRSNAVTVLMKHFFVDSERKVGAVAGNVKVGNECNLLTRWQAIEYTTSQNFDRMAYAAINAVTVVPGAIGAFRREAIMKAGGLETDTLAEDCDLTIRLLRAGYRVENENHAVALTEAPEKLRQFVKQRTRWCFGIMQTFWKNRDALFNPRHKGLGMWALPNMLIFQFLIPTFSPIADVLMILGLFTGNGLKVLFYYSLFLLVDASISIMAYIREREPLYKLFLIIPQRLCYRWVMYVVLFKSYRKAFKGELQSWGVLKRTGKVGDVV